MTKFCIKCGIAPFNYENYQGCVWCVNCIYNVKRHKLSDADIDKIRGEQR